MISFLKKMKIKFNCIANNKCIFLNILKNDKKNLVSFIISFQFYEFHGIENFIITDTGIKRQKEKGIERKTNRNQFSRKFSLKNTCIYICMSAWRTYIWRTYILLQ